MRELDRDDIELLFGSVFEFEMDFYSITGSMMQLIFSHFIQRANIVASEL